MRQSLKLQLKEVHLAAAPAPPNQLHTAENGLGNYNNTSLKGTVA